MERRSRPFKFIRIVQRPDALTAFDLLDLPDRARVQRQRRAEPLAFLDDPAATWSTSAGRLRKDRKSNQAL